MIRARVRSVADRPAIERGYVSGRYGQVHFRQAGEERAGKAPLLLFHQNPSSSFEYEPLMARLAPSRRVFALDTPGYGMSDPPPGPLSMADYAASLAEAADALGLGSGCDVYGFHTGALLAIEFAIARPNTRRVAVTGLPMRDPADMKSRLEAARNPPRLEEDGRAAVDLASRLWDYIVVNRVPGVPLEAATALWIDKLRPLDRSGWAYEGVWSYDYPARLPLLRQPLLLVQPNEDIRAQSLEAARLIRDVRVVEMPDFTRDILTLPAAIEAIAEVLQAFFD